MSGRRIRLREDIEKRYYRLWQFLGGYLHQNWPDFYPSPEKAVDTAIREYPIDLLRQVRQELAALLAEIDDDTRLRAVLNDGFGVNLYFKKAHEARAFAEGVERKLLASIKAHFDRQPSRDRPH